MKRLLCILSSLDTGGAETFMMKVFRALPEEYKIDFIVSARDGFYENEVTKLGGKIYRIPLRTKHPLLACYDIFRIVKDNNYKSIFKLCDTPIGVFDLIPAKLAGAKKICVRSCNANSNVSILRKIINLLLRPLFNIISNVKIAPSKLAAEYTFGKREVSKNRIVYLHNAIDLQVYKFDLNERIKIRKELGISSEKIVVGHIGRFNYQKNHEFLIQVFNSLHNRNTNTVLLLIGDGELKNRIEELVHNLSLQENILFLGVRSDIPSLLSAIDVLLLPSHFEGMPNVVIEAQAVGLPCVISDTITEEADITGLVQYISLNTSISSWVEAIEKSIGISKQDTSALFEHNGYNIYKVAQEFVQIVYP